MSGPAKPKPIGKVALVKRPAHAQASTEVVVRVVVETGPGVERGPRPGSERREWLRRGGK